MLGELLRLMGGVEVGWEKSEGSGVASAVRRESGGPEVNGSQLEWYGRYFTLVPR